MLRFICRETHTCTEGMVTQVKMRTFTNAGRLEQYLKSGSGYVGISLIGCEIINNDQGTDE